MELAISVIKPICTLCNTRTCYVCIVLPSDSAFTSGLVSLYYVIPEPVMFALYYPVIQRLPVD